MKKVTLFLVIIFDIIRFYRFQKIPDLPLTEEMVAENLSLLARIGDGLAHAYIKLDLREK